MFRHQGAFLRDLIKTPNLHQKKFIAVWCCYYSNMDLCFLTHVIQNFNISKSLIFNFNDKGDGG